MGDVDAEAIAQELVARKTPPSREEIMQLAFYLPDQGQHKAAGDRGSAFFAGAYRHGGITRLRSSCRSWPWSIQAITKYIKHKVPETVFTSFAILYDQEARPHRDSGNDATPNVVIKLSDFQGGGLWIEDPLGQDARDVDGRVIPGSNVNFDRDVIVLTPRRLSMRRSLGKAPGSSSRSTPSRESIESRLTNLSNFCSSVSIQLLCRQVIMPRLPGRSPLSLCARRLPIASDRMVLSFGFAIIVSFDPVERRSPPDTR